MAVIVVPVLVMPVPVVVVGLVPAVLVVIVAVVIVRVVVVAIEHATGVGSVVVVHAVLVPGAIVGHPGHAAANPATTPARRGRRWRPRCGRRRRPPAEQ